MIRWLRGVIERAILRAPGTAFLCWLAAASVAVGCALLLGAAPVTAGEVVEISSVEDLQKLLLMPAHRVSRSASRPASITSLPGRGVDQTCGNCQEPDTPIPMTYGLQCAATAYGSSDPPTVPR